MIDEVIIEMKAKKIKPIQLIAETGISQQTFSRFLNGGRVSQRTKQIIIDYLNLKWWQKKN